MKSRDFCYWLQGYFEIAEKNQEISLSPEQILTIKNHLDMVFVHEIDPSMGDKFEQDKLNNIHNNDTSTLRC